MPANTTNRDYTYPVSSDDVELYDHFQALASDIDTDIEDNIMSAWTSYTPTFTTSGGGSPSIGSGGIAHGRYREIGKTIIMEGSLVFGTSPNFGSGAFQVSLPATAATVTNASWIGQAYARDASGGGTGHYTGFCLIGSGGTIATLFASSGNGQMTSTSPFTWVATDFLRWAAAYERA